MNGRILVLAAVLALAACGDRATGDERGYTKAPLEEPGLLTKPEPDTPMPALGEPNRPRPVEPDSLPGQQRQDGQDQEGQAGGG